MNKTELIILVKEALACECSACKIGVHLFCPIYQKVRSFVNSEMKDLLRILEE